MRWLWVEEELSPHPPLPQLHSQLGCHLIPRCRDGGRGHRSTHWGGGQTSSAVTNQASGAGFGCGGIQGAS